MNIASARFKELQAVVAKGEQPAPRTEAEEDQMALEDMIFLREGSLSLARYKRKWRQEQRAAKLRELSPQDREIIEREQANQKDFPAPPKSSVYAPRPKEDGRE